MIDELDVWNLALIQEAVFVPSPRLTAITGETGSGKSALLSAFKLLMGERADAASVREGQSGLCVESRLFMGPDDHEGTTVQRSVSADGRSRVKVNGRISSVKELSSSVGGLMDLCGQHEHQRLLNPAQHLEMLDAWAGDELADLRLSYKEAFRARTLAKDKLDEVVELTRAQDSQLEDARYLVAAVDEVDPGDAELENLEVTLPRIEHAELLASSTHAAQAALSDEQGALDGVNACLAELQSVVGMDTALATISGSVSEAAILLEDAASDLRRYRDSVDLDPSELERQQRRLADIRSLLHRFGPTMPDLRSRYDRARELLSFACDGEHAVDQARQELARAEEALDSAAHALAKKRAVLGPRFCRSVSQQMERLAMAGSELIWDVRPLPREQWTLAGSCRYEFLYRSGEGLTPRPLRRIASGGELSRVLLALKVVMGAKDQAQTLIFDEVDAGVGGTTARALASVIRDLSQTHQVIVVTHLPQIAALADTHYVVSKESGASGAPVTQLVLAEGEQRVCEIARMLSGDTSAESIAHAQRLLDEGARS